MFRAPLTDMLYLQWCAGALILAAFGSSSGSFWDWRPRVFLEGERGQITELWSIHRETVQRKTQCGRRGAHNFYDGGRFRFIKIVVGL